MPPSRSKRKNTRRRRKVEVGVIMGSQSDWATLRHAAMTLKTLGIAFETRIISAHRTPKRLFAYAYSARRRGLKVIIAGAGGAAHLAGVAAALTVLPVFGVPIESKTLKGLDSLLSIAQMPPGIPVGTLAIGRAGAINAALLAAAVLAVSDPRMRAKLDAWRAAQAAAIPRRPKDEPAVPRRGRPRRVRQRRRQR
ncbi:MAG: 5-(carboxyamino)imidazole ribonucleotide mutase [Rhodospirillales bacterium RIFCSPLOWO2_12_FULL_67_15]|nr:MAG: 5-(carboxyamino)imidazole ribonucleotide mutase [Rhodospirillales bacterium RIFCSPLOWO2_12_FULL_67_15]